MTADELVDTSDKAAPTEPRVAVIGLGVHRSGTSAVTKALSLAGLALPQQLFPPSQDNPEGSWESSSIVSLNDEILARLGQHWQSTGGIPPERFVTEDLAALRVAATDVVLAEFGPARRIIVKDPRMAKLMPFWIIVLEDMGIGIRFVCCVRHPLEVARSLEQRDGLNLLHGLRMWLDYQLSAELVSARPQTAIVQYAGFLKSPADTVQRILRQWGLQPDPIDDGTRMAISASVKPELRHHIFPTDLLDTTARMASLINATYINLLEKGDVNAEAPPARIVEEWLAISKLDQLDLSESHHQMMDCQPAGPCVTPKTDVQPPIVTMEALLAMLTSTLSVGQSILKSQTPDAPTEYHGYIDKMVSKLLSGWCWRVGTIERVILKLYVDGACYGPQLASFFRQDLPNDGHHAFCIDLDRLALTNDSVIRMTTWDDAFTLIGSGRTVSQLRIGG